jgi:hypothetical protein
MMETKSSHLAQIDIIKGMAIIGVLALHSIPSKLKISSYAVFHIWQSVPILIVIFGINSRGLLSRYWGGGGRIEHVCLAILPE